MSPKAVYRAIGLAGGLALAGLVAAQLMTLLVAVVLTIILSLPLSAAASVAERHRVPRAAGALGALLAGCVALTGLGFVVVPAFVSQARQFLDRLPATIAAAERSIHGLGGARTRDLSVQVTSFAQGYVDHPQRLVGPIEAIGVTVAGIIVALVVIVLAAFLIALNPAVLVDGLLRLLPAGRRSEAREILERVRTAWLGWMLAVGIDMLVLGGLLWAGMTIIDLNFAIGFAVFSAFMTVIPNYGSVISAIPPILDGLAQSPGKAVLVLIVYLAVNQIEGNLVLPLIMARTVNMHPAVVSFGLLVMGALFGVIGVLIAIPLLSLAIILTQALWIEPQEARAARTESRTDTGPPSAALPR